MKFTNWIVLLSTMFGSVSLYAQNPSQFTLAKVDPNFNLSTPNFFKDRLEYTPLPSDAIRSAARDIKSLSTLDQPYQRYVWIPDGDPLKAGQVSFAVNTSISKASVIVKPTIVANGTLLRWDLRSLAPREGGLEYLITLYEKLANEPYFHVTVQNKNEIRSDVIEVKSLITDPSGSKRYRLDDQLWFRSPQNSWFILNDGAWQRRHPHFIQVKEVSAYGAHSGINDALILQSLTRSGASMVRYDWFISKILSTLDGGMYYDFIGIERNPTGMTAQDAFFNQIGLSVKSIELARADQRAALFRSKVTGRPRRIDLYQGSGVRLSSGSGLISLTHDIGEGEKEAVNDPIRNLLEFKDKARELIAERSNGMHYFLLFDNKGNLQDSAPDDVVKDHTIPSPNPARLQPAISCIRCHGPFDGWQPFDNEVQKIFKGLITVYDDLSSYRSIPDTLERLAGLYTGDLEKPIRRARDDYSDAVYIATNGMSVSQVSNEISQTYGAYNYKGVDALTACKELGYSVPEGKAVYYLNLLLPPLPVDSSGIRPEDPIIGALKAGLTINRFQWEAVYADAAFRSMQSQKARENINSVNR